MKNYLFNMHINLFILFFACQIRRMKQLEGEKDVLLQGLEVIDRAREWYLKQIAIVTEKQNYAEKTSCSVCITYNFGQNKQITIK